VEDPGRLDVGAVLATRYRLDAVLGEGAASIVYAATQLVLQRPVAVKVLRARQRTAHAHERFLREAQAVSRLAHPDVVQIYDFGIDEPSDRAFLVLEQVRGVTLVERLRARGPADEATAARWLGQVARALAHAHARGIVHRDVKPANLMLTDPGDGGPERVKVLDFGLAKMLGEQAGPALTAPGRPVGTLEFASPEQVLGQVIDAKSDLYALGCVLYAALTARAPWSELPPEARAEARLRAGAPPLPEHLVDGRAPTLGLRGLLGRLMASAPEDRPADAADVAAALERLADEASGLLTVPERPRMADAPSDRLRVPDAPTERPRVADAPSDRLRVPDATTVRAALPADEGAAPVVEGGAPAEAPGPVTRTVAWAPPRMPEEGPVTRTAPMLSSPLAARGGSGRLRRGLVAAVVIFAAGLSWAWASRRNEGVASAIPPAPGVPPSLAAPAPIRAVPAPAPSSPAPSSSPSSPPVAGASASSSAGVTLDTRPSGAAVHLGERLLGRTPLILTGEAAHAELVLKKPGFRDRVITASTAVERLEVVLERARAPRSAPAAPPSEAPYRFW
jgi:tRNA A-37 threonylcarbamoyl transferase component Bud32